MLFFVNFVSESARSKDLTGPRLVSIFLSLAKRVFAFYAAWKHYVLEVITLNSGFWKSFWHMCWTNIEPLARLTLVRVFPKTPIDILFCFWAARRRIYKHLWIDAPMCFVGFWSVYRAHLSRETGCKLSALRLRITRKTTNPSARVCEWIFHWYDRVEECWTKTPGEIKAYEKRITVFEH